MAIRLKKPGRKPIAKEQCVQSLKIDKEVMTRLKDLAAAETLIRGEVVSAHALIRDAINFVYEDNERLREVFRRARAHLASRKQFKKAKINARARKLYHENKNLKLN